MRETRFFRHSKAFISTIAGLILSGLTASAALADPHWFDPNLDRYSTLRVCFKVTDMKQLGENDIEFKLEYSGDDTGSDKLDRKNNQPNIHDVEYLRRGSVLSDNDPIVFAYRKGIYACQIIWEYGAHWVVASEDVTGE